MEKDLFTQKTRLVNAERSLKSKETKKAREDVRIATAKIETLSGKLSACAVLEPKEEDNRIFPMVYAGVIVKQDGQNLLTPMRYHCRPAGKPAFYDRKFPGLYNARRDNLEKFWGDQFGSHHAILVVESFYENVKRCTRMEHRELMPGETEGKRHSAVQAGARADPVHRLPLVALDRSGRSPIYAALPPSPMSLPRMWQPRGMIAASSIFGRSRSWLTPEGRSTQELQAILSDRRVPVLQHALAA